MISVIILTRDAEKSISKLLESLFEQTVKPEEIIVIDSKSADDTFKIAESLGAKTMTIEREAFDHGGTRNLAGKAASGDVLIFMTQDVRLVDQHALENLIKPFADGVVGAAYGRQLPHHDANAFAIHLRLFNYPERSYVVDLKDRQKYGIKTPFLSNSFAAYRRETLEKIDWFGKKLIMGEDMYAGAKMLLAGYKIAYVADAMVYHSHDYSVLQEFKRYFDIGVFHKTERWIRQEFKNIGGQGMKYVTSGLRFLVEKRKAHLVPEFALRASMKYLGFKMGYHYERLPKSIIPSLSMHHRWWHI